MRSEFATLYITH